MDENKINQREVQSVRGMHDWLGEKSALAARLENQARDIFARFNVAEIRTPVLEERALFERAMLSRHDAETAQTAYDAAVAQYNAAQADLESAQAKLRATRAQLVAAEAQVEKANAQVHQAQAGLKQAHVDLERTIIRSPVTGTVISRSEIGRASCRERV